MVLIDMPPASADNSTSAYTFHVSVRTVPYSYDVRNAGGLRSDHTPSHRRLCQTRTLPVFPTVWQSLSAQVVVTSRYSTCAGFPEFRYVLRMGHGRFFSATRPTILRYLKHSSKDSYKLTHWRTYLLHDGFDGGFVKITRARCRSAQRSWAWWPLMRRSSRRGGCPSAQSHRVVLDTN
eukprot:scaffold116410_cov32-Prasinocladus_malaysianus.AAC.1